MGLCRLGKMQRELRPRRADFQASLLRKNRWPGRRDILQEHSKTGGESETLSSGSLSAEVSYRNILIETNTSRLYSNEWSEIQNRLYTIHVFLIKNVIPCLPLFLLL